MTDDRRRRACRRPRGGAGRLAPGVRVRRAAGRAAGWHAPALRRPTRRPGGARLGHPGRRRGDQDGAGRAAGPDYGRITMTRDEIIALIVSKAHEHGIEPWELLGGAIAESGLN